MGTTTIEAAPAEVQTVRLYCSFGLNIYPAKTNIDRLTVMSLRLWTSRTTPRWSVKVSWLSVVLRYRIWVLLLNFNKKGTLASSGLRQMTIPS